MCVYATPAIDLLYFLIMSASVDVQVPKFDHFIKFYHSHLATSLQKLEYSEVIPTLKDIQRDILDKSFLGSMLMVEGVTTIVMDSDYDYLIKFMGEPGEEGDSVRQIIFQNKLYVNIIEKLLPFLGNRGMLEM